MLDFQKLTEAFEDAKNLQNLIKGLDNNLKKN